MFGIFEGNRSGFPRKLGASEFHPLPQLTINPADAEKYGIVDGQWAWIENDHGRFRQIARVSKRIREGMVHCEHAWWFPEQEAAEPSLFGVFDSNANNVTVLFETGEGALGSSIKSNICRVYPYKEGDEMPGVVVTRKGGFGDYEPGSMAGCKGGKTWEEGQDECANQGYSWLEKYKPRGKSHVEEKSARGVLLGEWGRRRRHLRGKALLR